ncbi:MAG: OmpA family protein [Bdellovibrionales bacterium]|nr:OmpA family protein [Bdellovibrionales bacterium]
MREHRNGPGAKRRAFHEEEVDAEGSWAISYGDMVTLLLTFFILFFNVNQKATTESRKLQTALLAELGAKASDASHDYGKQEPHLNVGPVVDSASIDEATMKSWGGVPHEVGSRILIEFPAVSFFDFGKTKVTKEGEVSLHRFVDHYIRYAGGNNLVIKAFTDDVKVDREKSIREGRKYEDNLELSALRAVAAMRVLQHAGIPLNRMRISGNGEMDREIRKLASAEPRVGKSKGNPLSRKVVLVVEPVVPEVPHLEKEKS